MKLRHVLAVNGVFSLVSGLAALATASALADLSGVAVGWPIAIGAGLLPFGVGLLVLARRDPLRRPAVISVLLADIAWVIAAVGVIALPGVIETGGRVVLGLATAVVAAVAWAQWLSLGDAA